MQDFVIELMFSVGHIGRNTVEKAANHIFTLPIIEIEGEMKRGPFIWVEVSNNTLVQFLVWERAESRDEAMKSVNSKVSRLLSVLTGIILEQAIFPESLSINFYTEESTDT